MISIQSYIFVEMYVIISTINASHYIPYSNEAYRRNGHFPSTSAKVYTSRCQTTLTQIGH